jgi:hypothetical protein
MTTYSYTIQLTDYTFIALETLLKQECKKMEQEYGIIAYNAETGEAKHPLGEILKIMRESAATAQLNSYYEPATKTIFLK